MTDHNRSSGESPFVSAAPRARLVNTFAAAYDNAVATARTCYSSRVVETADVNRDAPAAAQRDAIAVSTYQAGHHTIWQHAHFQFVLENVSRQVIWSFLHAHPFYNSEQVSQRYVAVKPDRVLVPRLPGSAQRRYQETIAEQMRCYQDLIELLTEPVQAAYFAIFPARRKKAEAHRTALRRKAQELARYCLPIATHTHLYHTISGLTLFRYRRLAESFDVPRETRALVDAMVVEVERHEPHFFAPAEDPLPLEQTHEFLLLARLGRSELNSQAGEFCRRFDVELDGQRSRLVGYAPQGETQMARAVREVVGALPETLDDAAAIAAVLAPDENPNLRGALNLTSLGKLSRALIHPHYTFQKKLSHSADSQDQRHRLTPGTRPVLQTHYAGGDPDVIVPELIATTPAALERFHRTMLHTWRAIDDLLADGVAPALALYLLPNAFPIRFTESGDLAAHRHKWVTRLCYNAQEEIWRVTVEEVQQVRALHPAIGAHLKPPCGVRLAAGARPICPEGPRYCGVQVWKQELPEYWRRL